MYIHSRYRGLFFPPRHFVVSFLPGGLLVLPLSFPFRSRELLSCLQQRVPRVVSFSFLYIIMVH